MRIKILILCFLFAYSTVFAGVIDKKKAVIAAKNVTSGTGLDKTNLVAWFDFADATDSHTSSYDLTEIGTPGYTAGPPNYGTSSDAGNMWSEETINDSAWFASDSDSTVVLRFRPIGDFSLAADYVMLAKNTSTYLKGHTSNVARGQMAGVNEIHSSTFALNTWVLVIQEYIAATDTTKITVNTSEESTAGTYSQNNLGSLFIGGSSASTYKDIDFDYVAFYNRALTSGEKTWLYNSGGTRTYADLD